MSIINKDSLETILRPFKNEIDNCVTKTNASVNNTISINNNSIATLSADQKSVKLSIGNNTMALNTDGELKVNGINLIANNNDDDDVFVISKRSAGDTYTKNKDIPYGFYAGSAVSIGTDIYLLGSIYYDTTNKILPYAHYNYKYNTLTNTYTKNKDIPYKFEDGTAVAIGTDIYLLGSNSSRPNYKYDTTTNTYTKNKDIPHYFINGSAVAIGNNIYLLGSSEDSNGHIKYPYAKYNYKYDTITDTYTKNTDIPYNFYGNPAVNIGTDIYLLGSYYLNSTYPYTKYNYKYDTITDTYTQNKDIPYDFFYGSAVAIGTDIYLLGSYATNYTKYNYKYDTTTDIYIKNTDIPYDFVNGSAVAIGNNIYLLGSKYKSNEDHPDYPYAKYNYKYTIPYNVTTMPKKSNHYIYTESKSYGPRACMVEMINDEYYTEYNNNSIIKSTAPVLPNGATKMYIKPGAILNGKEIPCKTKGWQTINILKYI